MNSLLISTWSRIEIGVGVFAACAPSIRQFFQVFVLRRRVGQASLPLEPSPGRVSGGAVEEIHKATLQMRVDEIIARMMYR